MLEAMMETLSYFFSVTAASGSTVLTVSEKKVSTSQQVVHLKNLKKIELRVVIF